MATKATRSSSKDTESDAPMVSGKDLEALIGKIIKKQFEEFGKQFEEFKIEMRALFEAQVGRLETRIKDLEVDLNAKTEKLMKLENTVDILSSQPKPEDVALQPDLEAVRKIARDALVLANDNEQYSRRNNVRIRGLKLSSDTNMSESVASWMATALSLPEVTSADIAVAHPLRSRKSTTDSAGSRIESIIVRFHNKDVKNKIMRNRKTPEEQSNINFG